MYKTAENELLQEANELIEDIYLEDETATQQERLKHAEKNNKLAKIAGIFVLKAILCNEKALDKTNSKLDDTYILNYEYMATYFLNYGVDLSLGKFSVDTFLNKFDRRAYNKLKDIEFIERELIQRIKKAVKQGKGIVPIRNEIIKEFRRNKNSANNIALTEVGRIQNGSRFDSFVSAWNNGIYLKKVWRHSGAAKEPRPWHINGLNGETQELFDKFSNNGLYPLDPTLPAREVCQCHCYMLPTNIRLRTPFDTGHS